MDIIFLYGMITGIHLLVCMTNLVIGSCMTHDILLALNYLQSLEVVLGFGRMHDLRPLWRFKAGCLRSALVRRISRFGALKVGFSLVLKLGKS
jgi:hypothetical protein